MIKHNSMNGLQSLILSRGFIKAKKAGERFFGYLMLFVIVFMMTMPLFWMILSSLKSDGENLSYPPTIIPQEWTLIHYIRLFKETFFLDWFKNSTFIAALTTILSLAISAFGAYSISRFRYRFFEVFSRLILFAYMVPRVLLLIPIAQIVMSVHLYDSLYGLVLVNNAFLIPYGLWTLRSYFSGIPIEIEEAALIDGCNRIQAFTKVVLPQALPGLIATGLFCFDVAWNEYLFSSVLLFSTKRQTLSAGVAILLGLEYPESWGLLMAAGTMITVPLILLFTFMQRHLIAGMGAGAVKG